MLKYSSASSVNIIIVFNLMLVVCELVLPVNMCIVCCNLVMILCRVDLLVSVNMLCACA